MNRYQISPQYSVRRAVLPIADEQKNPLLDSSNDIYAICQNRVFRQAILCASESLFRSMNEYLEGKIIDPKRKRQVELSVAQYWMRMSTRATPFGLFSWVGICDINHSESSSARSFKASIDADYEWIFQVSKYLEDICFYDITFSANDLINDVAGHYRLPYIPGQSDNSERIEVKKTFLISFLIKECSQRKKSFEELSHSFKRLYPEADLDVLKLAVKDLLSKDFLISSLRPNLDKPNLLRTLLKQIERCRNAASMLEQIIEISNAMEYASENIFSDKCEDILLEIINSMREICDTQCVIKANLVCNEVSNILQQSDFEQLKDFANFFMSSITHIQSRFTLYDEYKDMFYDEYGDFRLVQLSEMLDKNIGIGLPYTYKESRVKIKGNKTYSNEPSFEIKRFLFSRYREALNNCSVIKLDEMLNDIGENALVGSFPNNIDLIFKIANDENGNRIYICNKDFGCIGAGRTLGRFSSGWRKAISLIECFKEDEKEDYICCDLLYIPKRLHLCNVATSPALHDYCISFFQESDKKKISVSDIYVGIQNDRFFLYSKSKRKKIKVKTSNLLYYFGDSPEIRFLKEVQLDGIIRWDTKVIDSLIQADYIPEIRYKSFVLYPETWKIVPPHKFKYFKDFDEWFLVKYSFLRTRKLALLFADNELRIDVGNLNSRYLIFRQLLKEDCVKIIKTYECSDLNNATEIVASFYQNEEKTYDKKADSSLSFAYEHNVDMTIGTECLSFELYGINNSEKYVAEHLTNLVASFKEKNIIDSFFYLHYANPKYHIRIRFFKRYILKSIEYIINCFNEQIKLGVIGSFKICPYDREIERYGGLNGIEIAEKLFYIDSKASMWALKNLSGEEREMYFVVSCLEYLKIWGWDLKQQLIWIDNKVTKGICSDRWRLVRSRYYKYYLEGNIYSISELSLEKEIVFQEYSLQGIDLPSEQERILSSLLHVFFNRMFGMNREKENQLLAYTKYLLHEIVARDMEQYKD